MSDATDLRLGAAGAALGAGALGVGCYIAYNTAGIGREFETLIATLFVVVLIEIGVMLFGIAYTFHRNFSIIRTGRQIESGVMKVKAEVLPGDKPAIKQGIPAIIRAIGSARLALPAATPAASGPQSNGAAPATGRPTEPGSGPQ